MEGLESLIGSTSQQRRTVAKYEWSEDVTRLGFVAGDTAYCLYRNEYGHLHVIGGEVILRKNVLLARFDGEMINPLDQCGELFKTPEEAIEYAKLRAIRQYEQDMETLNTPPPVSSLPPVRYTRD